MTRFACLCLLFACAAKPPVASPAPPRPATVLFEIETNDLAAGPEKNVIYTDGMWQLARSGGGSENGRLSPADLALIQKDAAAPWSTAPHTGITCHMMHAPTHYTANGTLVYTDSGCESPVLDEVSGKALAEILATVTKAEAR